MCQSNRPMAPCSVPRQDELQQQLRQEKRSDGIVFFLSDWLKMDDPETSRGCWKWKFVLSGTLISLLKDEGIRRLKNYQLKKGAKTGELNNYQVDMSKIPRWRLMNNLCKANSWATSSWFSFTKAATFNCQQMLCFWACNFGPTIFMSIYMCTQLYILRTFNLIYASRKLNAYVLYIYNYINIL